MDFLWFFYVSVLVSFPSLWQNSWANQLLRRKHLFWFMVLEASVHSWLAPLLFGLWQGRTSWCGGTGLEQSCSPHDHQKQEKRRDWSSSILQGHASKAIVPLGPTPWKFYLPVEPQTGNQAFNSGNSGGHSGYKLEKQDEKQSSLQKRNGQVGQFYCLLMGKGSRK